MPSPFECPECLGRGRVLAGGNNPQPWEELCDVCGGRGELSAQEMYDCAVSKMMSARNTAHLFSKSRPVYFRYQDQAKHWLGLAKKARAAILEEKHAGSAHVGNTHLKTLSGITGLFFPDAA